MSVSPLGRLRKFFTEDLWHEDLGRQPRGRRFWLGSLRVTVHVLRSFSQNMRGLTASGLTLVSMLALVPMLALVFSIGEAMGYAQRLNAWLSDLGQSLPEDAQGAVVQLQGMVDAVHFGTLGLVGSLVVVWSGFALFMRVEQALNGIWRVRHSRPWLRRVSDFISLVVVVPPLVVLSLLGTSVFAESHWVESVGAVSGLGWLRSHGIRVVPFVMLWIAFSALYKMMPSVRVRWRSAFCGGCVAGTALLFLHQLYLSLQVGVAQANAIYATLAALPLLLVYLQLFWTVVLVGGEVSFAVQNIGSLHAREDLPAPVFAVQKRVMWHLMHEAAVAFREGRQGVQLAGVATRLGVPRAWVDELADLLVEAQLLVRVRGEDGLLVPARPPETISMSDVVAELDRCRGPVAGRIVLTESAEQRLSAASAAASKELSELAF